jgi:transcription elongation factor GreA
MKKQFQLTIDGKKELEQELDALKSQRGEVAERIASARDHGDLRENAEYDTARDEQARMETRIAEIEEILQNAEIIKAKHGSTVQVGTTVELELKGKQVVYTVVGPVEADPLAGKISNESPIGQALLGKKVGEAVTIETPKGKVEYKITAIR